MFNQLHAWLDRRHPLPARFEASPPADTLGQNWLTFLSIEEEIPFHKIAVASWKSISETADATKRYLAGVRHTLGGTLEIEDKDDKAAVLLRNGPPPLNALPIYLVSLRLAGHHERVVYVGKTKAASRFGGGHAVAIKLLDPKYRDYEKIVYRCSVTISTNEWILLEWINPASTGEKMLDDVESQLIYNFQPIFNTQKKKRSCAKKPTVIHIQNAIDAAGFLHDHIIEENTPPESPLFKSIRGVPMAATGR